MRLATISMLLLAAAGSAGGADDPERASSRDVIRALGWVESKVITDLDVHRWLGQRVPEGDPGRLSPKEERALVDLAITRLETAEARRRGLEVPEPVIEAALARFVRRAGGLERLQGRIRDHPGLLDDMRRDCHDRLLVRHLYTVRIAATTGAEEPLLVGRVSPSEVRARFLSQRERYRRPARARLRVIEVPAGAGAQEVLARLRNGEDFAAIARAESAGPHALEGGDLGWIDRGRLDPRLDAFAFGESTRQGSISDPILTPEGGAWIVRLEEREAETVRRFEEVQEEIAHEIRDEKLVVLRRAVLDRLVREACIRPGWLRALVREASRHIGPPARP